MSNNSRNRPRSNLLKMFEDEEMLLQDSREVVNGSAFKVVARPANKHLATGLRNPKAVYFLILWYIFSASTLFLNKYILTYLKADPYVLCGLQMFITMLCGLFQLRYPLGTYKPVHGQRKPSKFYLYMIIIGLLQLGTILFGLVALYFVAVSFAETVKSSAPIFTVFITRFFLGEKTGLYVFLSLFPVMMGLALCSANELSFHFLGFLCAMACNLCECIQSVFSKSLLSDKNYYYSPAQLQFYPNLAAVIIQCSVWIFFVDIGKLYGSFTKQMLMSILLDGISFHGQTITAYVLMSFISPVTYSVANTTKRAVLIWFSILIFGNPVTFFSGLGTMVVIVGVFLYSKARDLDARRRIQFNITDDNLKDDFEDSLRRLRFAKLNSKTSKSQIYSKSPFKDSVAVSLHSPKKNQKL